jgi:ketosteroid isomerase-like protein
LPRWITLAAVVGALLAGAARAADDGFADEAAAIRALRVENNRALAEHRLDDVMAIAAEDYVLVGGDDGVYRSKTEMTGLWREDFADPDNKGCVRTTDAIEVGQSRGVLRAAETGHWQCLVIQPGGERRRAGRYLAHWTKRSGAWRVVSDNYVTLRCSGAGCDAR